MQDMAAQLSGLGRLYNNPQAGDFGRITGLGMTPGGRGGGQHLPGQRSRHPWL